MHQGPTAALPRSMLHIFILEFFFVLMAVGFSPVQADDFTFAPAADTYVHNKTMPTTNFGAATTALVNNNNGIRVMLIRFDLSGVSGAISRLKLTIPTNTGSAANRPVKVFGLINGQSWVETSVTWSNAPGVIQSNTASPWGGNLSTYLNMADLYGSGAVLASFTPPGGAGTATAFDVISGQVFDFLNADADKVVTFLIAMDDPSVAGGHIFSTREAAAGPVLTVTTPPPPPPPNPTVVTFHPVADSYVNNKSTTSNYGSLNSVTINNNANGHRVALLRFDLSSITATISNLRLDLTGSGFHVGKTLKVYGVINGEGWSENTVTWANGPGVNHAWTSQTGGLADYMMPGDLYGGGAVLAQFTATIGSGSVAAFNVSSGPVLDFVNADADKAVTFLIAEDDPSDPGGSVISTREAPAQAPLLTVSCVPTSTAPPLIRVLLLGGQSNALGQASAASLPGTLLAPQTGILLYSHVNGQAANGDGTLGALRTLHPGTTAILGNFGPEVTLGQQLAPLLTQVPGTQLAIIKFAVGGTSLSFDWMAGGNATTTGDGAVYQTFQQVVAHGLAKLAATYPASTIQVGGMVWVQGEQDTGTEANAVAYGARLTTFISDVRATYGAALPFFFSRLSAQQTFYPTNRNAAYLALRQSQQNVASNVAGAYLVDLDGTNFTVAGDGVHFDANGQQALGTAFAAKVAGVLNPIAFTKNDAATQSLSGILNYSTLTTNAGVLNVNSAVGIGTSAVTVNNPGTMLRFGSVSQSLSSLTIGAGTTVTFTSGTAAGPFSGVGGKVAVAPAVASPAGALPEPVFVAASIAPAAPGGAGLAPAESGIRITWTAIPGRSYAVQTSADLVTWSPLISVGQVGQWTDTDLAGVGARFYRVREN
jgi:hypothetical protein